MTQDQRPTLHYASRGTYNRRDELLRREINADDGWLPTLGLVALLVAWALLIAAL